MDDLDRITRIAAGDREALAGLYRDHERAVFRFIRSRLNDSFEAADILQDVFLEVWRSAGRFEGRSRVTTWLFGIAWRKVIDAHRRQGKMMPTDDIPETEDESPDAAACLAAGQEAEHVRHCLSQLKPDHRTAISLAFYDDLSYPEIAEITGAPEGTIKTRIFHAKKLLMHCLSAVLGRKVAP